MLTTITLTALAAAIRRVDAPATRLVAVDGLGGAGKTVLAGALAGELGAPVVEGDGFYPPSAGRPPVAAGYASVSIWVETRRDLRLARGIDRDGEAARSRWTDEWMPAEDAYVSAMGPRRAAMLVVDGQGRPGLDPRHSVTILEARPPFDGLVQEM